MYTYETVSLNSEDYEVYGGVEAADAYLNASMSSAAQTWRGLTDPDDKARYLVQMTRILDRQRWLGQKTDADQALAWPRKDTGVDGVTDDVIPQAIVDACFEGAASLADGADFETTQNQGQKIQSLKAGSAALTYFRGAEGAALRFPLPIMELIRPYLAGQGVSFASGAGVSTGTDGESVTNEDFTFNRGL